MADLLLQREALHCRMIGGVPSKPTGAIYVTDEEILDMTRELPGLRQASVTDLRDLDALFTPTLPDATAAFGEWLDAQDHTLAQLCARAGLQFDEAVVLALALAIDVDRSRQRVLGYIQDDLSVRYLQLGTVQRLLPDADSDLLAPNNTLVGSGLVVLHEGASWAETTVGVPADLMWSILGRSGVFPGPVRFLSWGEQTAVEGEVGAQPLLFVSGGSVRERRAVVAAELSGPGTLCAGDPEDIDHWRAIVRAGLLHDLPVTVELTETDRERDWSSVEDHPGLRWIVSSESALSLYDLPNLAFREIRVDDLPRRLHAEQDPVWGDTGHQLRISDIDAIQSVVDSGSLEFEQAVKRLASGELDALAARVEVHHGWDDLVLPLRQERRVREVVDRYRNRARVHVEWGFNAGRTPGVVALFSGPSGTGKTLAGQIVAAEIGLDLYRVDLSSMVSKFIGESEKNLSRIFDAAENGAVALFFDEADAMFGKRSEVKDSHDRYANLSTSYLLQRIETFDGVVIMATNLSQNIDSAFKRRIDVQVTFAMPDEQLRREIWSRAIPAAHHVDVDIESLAARFELSGASIHNAVLGGAHLAAAGGETPSLRHYEVAVQRELQKLGQFSGFAPAAIDGENVNA